MGKKPKTTQEILDSADQAMRNADKEIDLLREGKVQPTVVVKPGGHGQSLISIEDKNKQKGASVVKKTQEAVMTDTNEVGFFGKLKRGVGFTSTGGMVGYGVSMFLLPFLPQVLVVGGGLFAGALFAKMTSKKSKKK